MGQNIHKGNCGCKGGICSLDFDRFPDLPMALNEYMNLEKILQIPIYLLIADNIYLARGCLH
jgi:hypothetical protein